MHALCQVLHSGYCSPRILIIKLPVWVGTSTCSHVVCAQDVDWEDYPAAGIFSRGDGAFLVARQGVMLTEYGKVDTRKAKARLLHGRCRVLESSQPHWVTAV